MGKVYISCTDKEWSDLEDGKINVIDYKGTEYVRVVRCKDCIYYGDHGDGEMACAMMIIYPNKPTDYCSLGERRKEGDNLISNRKCSECLHAQNITGLRNDCSNCGAKMDEDKGTIDIGNGFSVTANGAKMDEVEEDAKTN